MVGDGDDATSVTGFAADEAGAGLIINMSVWASVADLGAYVFDPEHVAIMRRRREWFEHMDRAYTALWWVPAGQRPTVREAEERVAHLRAHGPTPTAFTLAKPFPAPGGGVPVQRVTEDLPRGLGAGCGAAYSLDGGADVVGISGPVADRDAEHIPVAPS